MKKKVSKLLCRECCTSTDGKCVLEFVAICQGCKKNTDIGWCHCEEN